MIQMISTTTFIERANKIHNYRYDYSCTEYKGSHKKVTIICKIHGKFEVLATNHLSGYNCRLCSNEAISVRNKHTQKEFLDKAQMVHKGKYNYDKTVYTLDKNFITITCPKHGDFIQIAGSHVNGCGCPKCKTSKGENKIIEILEQNDIKYFHQYRFKNCKYKKCLPFDFYLPDHNICIEFDGIQHFIPHTFSYNKTDDKNKNLEVIQIRDKIKTDFCSMNDITLVRIDYKDFKNDRIDYIIKNVL